MQRAFGLHILQPLAQEPLDIHLAPGLHQKAPAVPSAHQMNGCGRRPQHRDTLGHRHHARHATRESLGLGGVTAGNDERRQPAIGRQHGAFADRLFLIEIAVAGAAFQRQHQRMLREIGLDQGAARLLAAPRPSRHLRHQRPGALTAARIARFKCKIGINDADQCQMRKMMALGHQLRADDEVIFTAFHLADRIAQQNPARQVARQDGEPRLGKALCCFLRQALDARPHRHELSFRPALRTSLRHRFQMPAMVTHELAPEAMLDQRGRAIGTLHAMPAGPA